MREGPLSSENFVVTHLHLHDEGNVTISRGEEEVTLPPHHVADVGYQLLGMSQVLDLSDAGYEPSESRLNSAALIVVLSLVCMGMVIGFGFAVWWT